MKRLAPLIALLLGAFLLIVVPGLAQTNQTFLPLAALPAPTATNTVPPTATEIPPTVTGVPPTATQELPTATATEFVPSATATEVPPTATATEVPPTATATQQPPTGENVVCTISGATELCAWVSEGTPLQNSDVTVYGRLTVSGSPASGQQMATTWHYKSTDSGCIGFTDATGIASCLRGIGRATIGFRVNIDVTLGGITVTTFFTPR